MYAVFVDESSGETKDEEDGLDGIPKPIFPYSSMFIFLPTNPYVSIDKHNVIFRSMMVNGVLFFNGPKVLRCFVPSMLNALYLDSFYFEG